MVLILVCFMVNFGTLIGGQNLIASNNQQSNILIQANTSYSKQYQAYQEHLRQISASRLDPKQTDLHALVRFQSQPRVNGNDDGYDNQQFNISIQAHLSSYQNYLSSYQNYLSYDQQKAFYESKSEAEHLQLIEKMSKDDLDRRIGRNGESIGHLLLRNKERQAFEHWLNKGASCSVISCNNEKDLKFNNVTILHHLCIKGLDYFPNLLDLIKIVLNRNHSLLSVYNGEGCSALSLILFNTHLNDDTTLEIVKEFSKFLDLQSFLNFPDKIGYLKELKPKTMRYIFLNKSYCSLVFPSDREEIRNFILNLSAQDLDKPVLYNQACLGQVLLQDNDIELFKLFLDQGAHCTSKMIKDVNLFNSEGTVLSLLCKKGLNIVPDLVHLIERVLDRNPSLLFHLRNGKKSVVSDILNNKRLDDETALKILKIFTSRGFNFAADHLLFKIFGPMNNLTDKEKRQLYNENYNIYMLSYKAKSVQYIQSCIQEASQYQ